MATKEGMGMPGIVEYPQVVREAVEGFGDLFANEPQRRHFAEYLTGLMIAERKTVLGMNREFANTTDQSCLNKFLTEVEWDVVAMNERRLASLQKDPSTRYCARGVIPIDNVLIDHDGQLIEDAGWFWDHAEQRHKIAHDYLIVNYVCPSGKHYPLEFRRFRKRDQCEAKEEKFVDHTKLCCELVDWVIKHRIPGDFTIDSYFTNAKILNHIHGKKDSSGTPRAYVGDLKFNRHIVWKGEEMRADVMAAQIEAGTRKSLRRDGKQQWYFTATIQIPEIRHKVRIVILWGKKHDKEPKKILVTNRTAWEVVRILGVYRNRWTGTETFHRDGKQELGMGDCQLRDGQGQTRHMYLVMLAYSLLEAQLGQNRAKEWALCKLTTIGEACRAVLRETLRSTLQWAIEQATEYGRSSDHIVAHLRLT